MKKVFATALFGMMAFSSAVYAEEEMTYEAYVIELASHKQREDDARAKIGVLEGEISELNTQIKTVKDQTTAVWNSMLEFVGVSQEQYDGFVQGLDAFVSKVRGFEAQFSEDFSGWATSLKGADKELKVLKKNPIAIFPRLDSKFANADRAIEDSKSALRLAKESNGSNAYTVRLIPERRDCLWRIAEYSETYGDPFQWPKIYSANKDQIKDEDLIFPGQTLQIPR